MDFFYDSQLKRYLTQFMRIMSSFGYKDARGQIVRAPVRYGNMNRQVAQILKKNSENTVQSAPFIACYIKDVQYDMTRLQDPTFVSKLHIRERDVDPVTNTYLNTQGRNYTVERIMPCPYIVTFSADIWSSNEDQKLQLWEQISVLFNPSMEIQTTDNYIDWTSLSVLTLEPSMVWSSRSIPQGVEQEIDILTMNFKAPIWITPPAKVKRLGIVTKIIADVYALNAGEIDLDYTSGDMVNTFGASDGRITITPGDFDLLVLNNVATLIKNSQYSQSDLTAHLPGSIQWNQLLDMYPGKFRANLSQLRLKKADGNEIVAFIALDPSDESRMVLSFDTDTVPANTIVNGRGTVDAIVDPETYKPSNLSPGTRLLILGDINPAYTPVGYDGPDAWKNTDGSDFRAAANDIIQWDGAFWTVIFNSQIDNPVTYITNSYTGIQYKWSDNTWTKSFEGIYSKESWRLVL